MKYKAWKGKMWAVCYEDLTEKPGTWVPYGTGVHHFRGRAVAEKNEHHQTARVLPVTVEVIMPKKRTALNRGVK